MGYTKILPKMVNPRNNIARNAEDEDTCMSVSLLKVKASTLVNFCLVNNHPFVGFHAVGSEWYPKYLFAQALSAALACRGRLWAVLLFVLISI